MDRGVRRLSNSYNDGETMDNLPASNVWRRMTQAMGGVLSFITTRWVASKKKVLRGYRGWVVGRIVGALVLVGIGLVFPGCRADQESPHPPEAPITILELGDGNTIECERFTEDGYCLYTVKGTVSYPLESDRKIYIAIKESGGDEWWISGGAIQQQDLVNDAWEQPWASFGHKDSPVKRYHLCAFMTTEQYPPPQKFQNIPSDAIASTTIWITRN